MRIRNGLIIFIILFIGNTSFGQIDQLTKEQKVKDFLYVCDILKDNYPFFGVRKRENGIDWLAKKKEYLTKIEKTENDSAYISTLKKIFGDLNDGHVNFNTTRFGNEGFYKAYKNAAIDNPHYNKWVEMFENPDSRIDYWSDILKKSEKASKAVKADKEEIRKLPPNYSDTLIDNGKIGIMTILSFNTHLIDKEKVAIDSFFNQTENCKYLIINIQNNTGGATKYWKNNIVERLLSDTVIYTSYPVIKGGPINRHFYSDFFDEAKLLKKTESLKRIPYELIKEKFYIKTENDTITPNNPINFKGEIFLLVNKKVFSSSEGFAQFCKTTGWATIAGERTGGDGIGSDPALIMLPESGILMGFPSLVGLNHDGSLNSEEKTAPDIKIEAANSQERLDKLIKYLEDKK